MKLHLARATGFIIMGFAVFGLYSVFLAFSEMGSVKDSHLLARVGVPGFGIILICAVVFTVLSEMSLIKHWNDARN